jgi:N-methylhydantoinase B
MGPGIAVVSGHDWRRNDGEYINELLLESNGGPASPYADGWLNYGTPVIAGMMYRDSVEVDEQKYPILVHSLRILRDTGGAGKHRGAPGQEVIYGPRRDPITVIYPIDGNKNPPRGVRGGHPGNPALAEKIDRDGNRTALPLVSAETILPGEWIVGITSGGGGYGNPLERDPERVLHDVVEGWISTDTAHDIYGIVLRDQGDGEVTVDEVETANRRTPRATATTATDT